MSGVGKGIAPPTDHPWEGDSGTQDSQTHLRRFAQKGTSVTASHERTMRMLELRTAGLSLAKIGEQFGVSKQRVCMIINGHLKRLAAERRDHTEELRSMEDLRLDRALAEVWRFITAPLQGTPNIPANMAHLVCTKAEKLAAVDRLLRLSERRAKLHGLDAPSLHMLGSLPVEDFPDEALDMLARGEDLSAVINVAFRVLAERDTPPTEPETGDGDLLPNTSGNMSPDTASAAEAGDGG